MKQRHTPQALREVALDLMRLQSDQWRLEIAWARRLRERVSAASAGVRPGATGIGGQSIDGDNGEVYGAV